MKKLLPILLLALPLTTFAIWYNPLTWGQQPPQDPNFGATVFRSSQVGTSPQNGYYLQTDGTNSSWQPVVGGSGGGGGGAHSTSTAWGSILYVRPNNATDIYALGYDGSGVATSSNEAEYVADPTAKLASYLNGMKLGIGTTTPYAPLSVVGEIVGSYFTATGTRASTFPYSSSTIYSSFVTASTTRLLVGEAIKDGSGIDVIDIGNRTIYESTGNNVVLDANNGILSSPVSGTNTFNFADLSFPTLTSNGFLKTTGGDGTLSVDTTTYAGTSRQLTVAGTANQITSSAGAQDLSADRTWTLSIPSQFNIQQASTTVLSALWAKIGATASTTIGLDGSISTEGNLSFNGEIQPDGSTCSDGQILKKTGANDWDCAEDATGGGGSSAFEVATTSDIAISQLAYINKTAGRTTLASVATSSVTINAPLTSAGTPGYVVGGSGWTLDIDDIKAVDLDLTDITLSDFTNDAGFTTFAWPFTANTGYVSTTTTLGFLNGLFSTASTTVGADLRHTAGYAMFGTTTNTAIAHATIASTTAPQLSLSSSAGIAQWVMRNAGGNLYFATTTAVGTATSSVSAFSINNNGFPVIPSLSSSFAFFNSSGTAVATTSPVFYEKSFTNWASTTPNLNSSIYASGATSTLKIYLPRAVGFTGIGGSIRTGTSILCEIGNGTASTTRVLTTTAGQTSDSVTLAGEVTVACGSGSGNPDDANFTVYGEYSR